ncbi:MAG: hypothetical protein LHV68_08370 [Elusimicrobia bacterium]|nr:hypothetical protein [Candidatus Liberimonas magnetica]
MRKVIVATSILLFLSVMCDAFFPAYEGYYAKDSDNLFVEQHIFSINDALRKHSTLGLLFGYSGYNDSIRSQSTQSYQLKYTNKAYDRWLFSLQGGSLQYLKRSMPLFGGNAVYTTPGGFRFETTVDKTIVDTFICFDNDISVTTLFASLDVPIHKKFVAIAGVDSRSFSDGNERTGLLLKGILFLPPEGLSLQVWHRQFRNTNINAIGYFNPETINFQRYIAAYRRGLVNGVRMSIKAGPGSQQVNNDNRTDTFYFESGLEKIVQEGLSFTIKYIYTDSFIDNNLLSYKINIVVCNLSYLF